MSNRLACQLNNRIRAIASVSGTIGTSLSCNPPAAISVCHFHGTNDQTVAYTGNMYGNDAEELVNYWVNFNNCDTIPVIDSLPDTAADGKTVIHYTYKNGDDNTSVEFYKIINGEHEWLSLPTNDISYTFKIWDFFRRNLKTQSSAVNKNNINNRVLIYPNPAKHTATIKANDIKQILITDITGKTIINKKITQQQVNINTLELSNGIYLVKVITKTGISVNKLIVKN